MRNEYLRALVAEFGDGMADGVMGSYNDYATWLASGRAPRWYYRVWVSGLLVPLVKRASVAPGVSPDVRPICCGEAERRAIERTLAREAESAFARVLAPQQVAVGVPGGAVHGQSRQRRGVGDAEWQCGPM